MTPPAGVYLENDLLKAPAVKAIRSAHSFRVLLEFYRRRVIHKRKDRKGGRAGAVVMNNGEITLPYRYAIEKMGIPQTTFSRCLDELVKLGFLDVAEPANGLHKMPTKWTLSERWKRYGQADFVSVERKHLKPPALPAAPKGQAFGNAQKEKHSYHKRKQKRGNSYHKRAIGKPP